MIALTLLTKTDCAWCRDGKKILVELGQEFSLQIEEVDLDLEQGRRLADKYHLMFAPGLIADGDLIAHGRLSKRSLRSYLTNLTHAQ
jgi:glutaredoxin